MRVFIVLIWCFWFVGVDAQNRSIVFREGNWEKILKQAKKEKKLIGKDSMGDNPEFQRSDQEKTGTDGRFLVMEKTLGIGPK